MTTPLLHNILWDMGTYIGETYILKCMKNYNVLTTDYLIVIFSIRKKVCVAVLIPILDYLIRHNMVLIYISTKI